MTAAVLAADAAMSTTETLCFWVLAPTAVAGALGMLLSRNAVHSALWLVLTMLSLATMYFVQGAPFLGAVQIIVYTGAVMILFLFVLMLVGRDHIDALFETLRGQRWVAVLLGAVLALILSGVSVLALTDVNPVGLGSAGFADNITGIATLLFSTYVMAFEVVSVLLVVAVVGAMLLSHIEKEPWERRTQRQLSRQRFRSGGRVTPMPGPGVMSVGNAATTPALLPDGTIAPDSISPVLDPDLARSQARAHALAAGPDGQVPDGRVPALAGDHPPALDAEVTP